VETWRKRHDRPALLYNKCSYAAISIESKVTAQRAEAYHMPTPSQTESNRDEEQTSAVELTDTGQTNVTTREDVPPDGGYGWVCTACLFLINAHTWGVNSVSTSTTALQAKETKTTI
jgi:hypothetical protein